MQNKFQRVDCFCHGPSSKNSIFPRIFLAGALTMFVGATSADNTASQLHLLPFVVDGEGIQSRLLVTNISESSSNCSLDLAGSDLDADRFEDHFLLTADGTEHRKD